MWMTDKFDECASVCSLCSEPAEDPDSSGRCIWCRIDDGVRRAAAKRSMLAATLYFGLDRGLPLEFEGLEPKGKNAAAWIAETPRRQAEAMAMDVALLHELFGVMKKEGLLDEALSKRRKDGEGPD